MILANTTSVGMKPNTDKTPLAKVCGAICSKNGPLILFKFLMQTLLYRCLSLQKALSHYSLVFDAIYTPKWTRLLQEAQECGATVVFGTEMFINQAFVQFERFTGLPGKTLFHQLPMIQVTAHPWGWFDLLFYFLSQHRSNSLGIPSWRTRRRFFELVFSCDQVFFCFSRNVRKSLS